MNEFNQAMMMLVFNKKQITILALPFALVLIFFSFVQAQKSDDKRGLGLETVKMLPGSAKRFALIIGVDNYSDTQITTLGGASNDAKALADALVKYAGFQEENVILLTSTESAERQPTRGNILRRLSNLASVIPKDGMLLFSFAGHGMERNGQAFLLSSDAQVNDDVDLLESTTINVQQVKERIKKIGVGQVLILLDACRNDPAGRSDSNNPLTENYTRAFGFDVANREIQAFATIYATAVGQRAYEYKERKQGYFTWALVEGLKGEAANAKGKITLASLISYLQESVPKKVLLDLGQGKIQRPYAEIGGYKADDLVIAVTSKVKISTPSIDSATIELSYWESIKDSQNAEDFNSYLKEYPKGRFTSLAKNRLQALTKKQNVTTQSPEEMASITNTDDLGIAGTWTGTRGLESSLAFLIISGSKGNTFTGVLKLKGFHIAVQGQIDPKTRQMTMSEMKVIQASNELTWALSAYTGTISRDKKEMSGIMSEGSGNVVWSFTKVD